MSPASMHNLRQTNSPARRDIQQLLKTEQQFLAPGSVKLSIFKTILLKKETNKGDSVVYVTSLSGYKTFFSLRTKWVQYVFPSLESLFGKAMRSLGIFLC